MSPLLCAQLKAGAAQRPPRSGGANSTDETHVETA